MKNNNKNLPDVYALNAVEKITDDSGKLVLKRKKIGLAYIPDIKTSRWCNELFKNEVESVLVNCEFDENKNVWKPIQKSKNKKPSFVNEFTVINVEE